jgi:hypothetical protein
MSKQITGTYADVFKGWQGKLLGSKPTAEMLDAIHKLGARPGKQALACSMALRPEGVTGSEIVIACGAPQLNKMRGFIADALTKREAVPPRNGHTVYKLTLTAKGAARIKGKADAVAKAEKPAKVKAAPKPRKPKATVQNVSDAAVARAEAMIEADPELAHLINHKPEPQA